MKFSKAVILPSQKDSKPLMLQQIHPGPSSAIMSATAVKSFNGQIVHLQPEPCLLFHFSALQHNYRSILLLFWTSLLFRRDTRVHILNECLLKGSFPSLGAADAEQEHGVREQKCRTSLSYNVLGRREKIKETDMWQHWNFPKRKEVKIRSVMRTEALEIIHLQ